MKTEKRFRPAQKHDGFTARAIRTFLAEDDPFTMALLARLLAKDQRITIVGSATDGRNAVCRAATLRPDLVLMDLHMPGMDGADATRLLKQIKNPPIIFAMTSDDTPKSLTRSLSAGADAFLVKAADMPIQIRTAIQDFFGGEFEVKSQSQSEPLPESDPGRFAKAGV